VKKRKVRFMNNRNVIVFTLIVSLGGFIFGFDASVISGAIGQISVEFNLSPIEQGLIVGAPTLGGILATLFAGFFADTFGRRTTLKVIAFLYLVSAALSAIAVNEQWLVIARFIGGLAFEQTGINQIFDERVGILAGSLASACLGYVVLRLISEAPSDDTKVASNASKFTGNTVK
jgi:MFS family permease